jgi:hypothetical protein
MGTGVAQASGDVCVSINGIEKAQVGTATCTSVASDTNDPNRAIARGWGAVATAGVATGDSGNTATASGDYSTAFAGYGDNNTANAEGHFSTASAGYGDNNTAAARDNYSDAFAGHGDNNTAAAGGDYSFAFAGYGDNNAVTASAEGCFVAVREQSDVTRTCAN